MTEYPGKQTPWIAYRMHVTVCLVCLKSKNIEFKTQLRAIAVGIARLLNRVQR